MKPPVRPIREADIQRAIVDYLRAVAPDVLVFAIPNASRRLPGARAGNAVAGLTRGIPDIGLVLPDGRAAFIEVKAERGKLSEYQQDILRTFAARAIPFAICRSSLDVAEALRNWGCQTREAA